MNSKLKKKKGYSTKTIAFWSSMATILLVLIIVLIVRATQIRDVSSYKVVDYIYGQEMFDQKESEYYVLFYDFNTSRETESFDKGVYQYLTYYRDNAKATKIFGMDSDENRNKLCLVGNNFPEQILGATEFPNKINNEESYVLKVNEETLPLLLVISDGSVTDYKTGESAILAYLKDAIK